MTRACFRPGHRQTGMALISALLLLLVVTIMAVSMFRSFGMQEKIAGNTREKQRALNAAISAQNYAEWFLKSGTIPPSVTCTTTVPAATAQICNAPINVKNDFSVTPWATGVTYTPFTTNGGNGVQSTISAVPTAGSIGTYYATPLFYITDLGPYPPLPATSKGELYQIDALGYGGTPSAQAVVESTYLVSTPGPSDPNI
jgi:type IV pilus assembly protein PilX